MVAAIFLIFALYTLANFDKIFNSLSQMADAEESESPIVAIGGEQGARQAMEPARSLSAPTDQNKESSSLLPLANRGGPSIEGSLPAYSFNKMATANANTNTSKNRNQSGGLPYRPEPNLSDARKAYWENDLLGAVHKYQKLAKEYPDNADVFGELGNVYLQQGEVIAAAEAYYTAAKRLRDRGEHEQVRQLIEGLKTLGSKYAKSLIESLPEN